MYVSMERLKALAADLRIAANGGHRHLCRALSVFVEGVIEEQESEDREDAEIQEHFDNTRICPACGLMRYMGHRPECEIGGRATTGSKGPTC